MTDSDTTDHTSFIRTHTILQAPPLVPELRLHLASEVIGLWNETEALAGGLKSALGNLPPPYWAFAWAGGQALARYVLDHPEDFAQKSVLDFGAGSGLLAIAAARAGAVPVVAAEIDAFALAAIEMNASANDVFVEPLATDIIGTNSRWDIILAGDMCYERPLAEQLTQWLRSLATQGTRVLLGDPGRNYFPRSGVTWLATYSVPTSRELEDRDMRETSVYLLLP